MSTEEIIEKLQEAVNLGDSPHRGPFGTFVRKEYLVEAIDKLRTHPDTQPNEPKVAGQLKQIAQIFNCDLSDQSQLKALYDKLQIWQQAEKDGRLVVLCKKDELPAADVEPVRHGQWDGEGDGYAETEDGGTELVYDVWRCSACGYTIDDGTDDPERLPNYCPNCGAKMDGGGGDA